MFAAYVTNQVVIRGASSEVNPYNLVKVLTIFIH